LAQIGSLEGLILSWRLLRNRLPTKDNLVARDILPHDSQLCVVGCGSHETTQHLFMSCFSLGLLFGLGLASYQPNCIVYWNIFFSLFIPQVACVLVVLYAVCLTLLCLGLVELKE